MKQPEIKMKEVDRGFVFRSTFTTDASTIEVFFGLFDAVRQCVAAWLNHATNQHKLRIYISLRSVGPVASYCEECAGMVDEEMKCYCGPSGRPRPDSRL